MTYYPDILEESSGEETILSTNIRIKREGVWYRIPYSRSFMPTDFTEVSYMYQSLAHEVYTIQHLYIAPDGRADIDILQIDEDARLKKLSSHWN
tara:strand:- start:17557 stop:17838 length:282 start_codon:yes stop_codon:yes gene_type:complete